MEEENRRRSRKDFSEEISFESMLTGQTRRSLVFRNGFSMDISNGGLGIIASYRTTEGEILKLSVPVRGLDVTVPVFAEVMWVEPFEDNYRAGLRFLGG